jgi:mycofactocin precursor
MSGEAGIASQPLAGEDLIIQEISIDGICGVY